jgi:multicomponent Na+:H+ antiporter subunit E
MLDKPQREREFKPRSRRPVLITVMLLMTLWILLSGHFDWFHLALGVLSVGLVVAINRPQGFLPREDAALVDLNFRRLLLYIPWLGKEMVLSALHVARVTLSPRMPLAPDMIIFKSEQPNDMARMILGNSITLTPGTLTVDLDQQQFLVHALTPTTAEGLLNGTMQEKVARLFTRRPGKMVFDVQRGPQLR